MYSVNLNNNRVILQCSMVMGKYHMCSAVYDTGARYTALSAIRIDARLSESQFRDNETKFLSGYIEGSGAKFYKVTLPELAIGNIILKNQSIWITFDENVTDNVVGYDLLKQIARLYLINSNQELFFQNNDELAKYVLSLHA